MPERINIDTDAGPRSTVGVGTADLTSTALHEIAPSWLQDGFGVRGPQRQVQREMPVSPAPMDVGMPAGRKTSSDPTGAAPCAPTAPPDNTDNYAWMTLAGDCQWVPVCDAECGATAGVDGGSP